MSLLPFLAVLLLFPSSPRQPQALPPIFFPAQAQLTSEREQRLEEAKNLNSRAVELYGLGQYNEAIIWAKQALSIRQTILGEKHPDTAQSLNNLALLYESQGDYAAAEPFYQQALAIWRGIFGEKHPQIAASLNNLGALYAAQGNYGTAEPLYQEALAIRRETLGEKHPDTAESFNNLGTLYDSQGHYAAAEPLYQQALAIWRDALGEKHPNTAACLNNLGALYVSQGHYAVAEPLYQQALAIRREVLGENHPSTAISLNNLGALYVSQGKYAAAEPFYQAALAIRQEIFGEKHPDVAASLNNLGALYDFQGDYSAAEPLYRQALAMRQETLGENHPATATSLNNLAELYVSQGNYAAAEPLHRQALAIRQETLGEKHPLTAASLNNLGALYDFHGDYAAAEPLYRQALEIRQGALGEKHPLTAISLNNLAELYVSQGDYSAAEPLYRQALAIQQMALGEKHPDVAASLNNLALLYDYKGDEVAAEAFYRQALALRQEVLGAKHPDTAQSLNNLGALYVAQGHYAAAQPLYEQALEMRQAALGKKHPDVATSLNNLAGLYDSQGNDAAAQSLYEQALEIRQAALGEKHPDVATSLNNLGALYASQGNYGAAEPLYRQALEIRQAALGEKHPDVAVSLNNLGALYASQGNYSAAEPLYRQALTLGQAVLGEKHRDLATILNNLAALRWAMGDISLTLAFLRQGTDIEESNLATFLNQIGDEDRKRRYIQTLAGTINATISLHLNRASNNPAAADLALTTILRRKGRVLDALSNAVALLRQRLNPAIQSTFDHLGAQRSRLASLSFQGPGKQPLEAYKKLLATLNQDIQQLETRLSRQSAEFRTENQPITVGAVQNLLPKDGTLVEYIVYKSYDPKTNKYSKPRYAAYILLPNGAVKGIDLGDAAEIDQLIAAWLQTLNTPPGKILPYQKRAEKEQKAAGALLEAKIFAPLRPYLKNAQHLLIAPDSQLNLIPFAALPDGAEGKYLIQDYQLTFLTSGRDLVKLQNPAPSRSPSLVMGNPDYGAPVLTKPRDGPRSADIGQLNAWCCSPLPGAAAEVDGLRPLMPNARIYTGKDAVIDNLELIKAPTILHLAAHGFFLPDNPPATDLKPGLTGNLQETLKPDLRDNPLLRSGLALTGFNPRENNYDGALTALEATTLDLWGTKLVVLSACQTGVGDVRTGEGVYGLRRAFVLAGTESQVMSLWNVSDQGTQSLMVKYYQKLQQGAGRSEALRQVQLEMSQGEEYPHPYYWAAFIPSGDWRPLSLK